MIMRRLLAAPVGCVLSVMLFSACDRTPDYVIKPDDMAALLVDIHKGEGVVDLNTAAYRSDSARKVLKQSIYMRHGVTAEQVDTSLVWYGHNIEKYIEVYDKVIDELEKELKDADVAASGEKIQLAVVGDSVDAWNDTRYRRFAYGYPADNLKFSFRRDENWEEGDVYTWRMFVANRLSPMKVTIGADYNDGTTDYVTTTVTSDGWNELKLQSDTARSLRYVYGFMEMTPKRGEIAYVDSITLTRTRFNPDVYNRSGVKHYSNGKKEKN